MHAHDHVAGQSHSHGHGHLPDDIDANLRALLVATVLNAAFVVAEFGFGYWTNSSALMADAGHNLSDVLGLILAWSGASMGRRPVSSDYTYGYRGASVMASLGNAVLLLVTCGAILLEAVHRLLRPEMVSTVPVMAVAAIGIVINGVSAWLLMRGSREDLNMRGAFAHMAADALVSAGVVVSAAVIGMTGWQWIDPLTSLAIVATIVWGTWSLLRQSMRLALAGVPHHIDITAVRDCLQSFEGVAGVHDLHVWAMSTTETALTAHLVMPHGNPDDRFLLNVRNALRHRFGIGHATLQVGRGTLVAQCTLADPTDSGADRHGHVHAHGHNHHHHDH